MGLKDGMVYEKIYIFYKELLLTLTPEDIVYYFNLKVFGTTQSGKDALPKFGHPTSVCSYKKALSYFMPNKLLGWNIQSMSGNPTKSVLVNVVINKVKKIKVCKQGISSRARRALTIDKFKFLMYKLNESNYPKWKYAIPALCVFQYHLISSIDDTCQFMMNGLIVHEIFPLALCG